MKNLPKDWIFAHDRLMMSFTDAKLWLITYLLAPVMMFVEKYIFDDWAFIPYLLLVMLLDILTAWIRILLKENKEGEETEEITSRGMRQSLAKSVQYFVFLITVHALTNIHVRGERIEIYDWILDVAYTFLIVIEVKSIWENLMGMRKGFNLSGFMKKITNSDIWEKDANKEQQKKSNSEDGAE